MGRGKEQEGMMNIDSSPKIIGPEDSLEREKKNCFVPMKY